MKTPTTEELAEIAQNAASKHSASSESGTAVLPWSALDDGPREARTVGIQAVLTALYASVEGFPSVEELCRAFVKSCVGQDHSRVTPSVEAALKSIRNLTLAAHLAERQQWDARLAAVRDFLLASDNVDNHETQGINAEDIFKLRAKKHACRRDLEAALSAAPVEHVPEVKLWSITWICGEGEEPQIRGSEMIVRQAWKDKARDKGHWKMWDEHGKLVAEDADGMEVWAPFPEPDPHAHLKAAWEDGKRIRNKYNSGEWSEWFSKTVEGDYRFRWDLEPERYEIEPDQPATIKHNNVDFIKHKAGDPCPVDGETPVEVLLAHTSTGQASAMEWHWGEGSTEVLGYRVITPATEAQAAPAEQEKKDPRTLEREQANYIAALQEQRGQLQSRVDELETQVEELRVPQYDRELRHAAEAVEEIKARAEAAEARVKELEAEVQFVYELAPDLKKEGMVHIGDYLTHWNTIIHWAAKQGVSGYAQDPMELLTTFANLHDEALERIKDLEGYRDGLGDAVVQEQAAKHEALSRLAMCLPRPVSVKPTKEDAGCDGEVLVWREDGTFTRAKWDAAGLVQIGFPWGVLSPFSHWLPGSLSRLMPEAAPEEKERKIFEQWWSNETSQSNFERFSEGAGQYKDSYVQGAWAAWKARAGKEGA